MGQYGDLTENIYNFINRGISGGSFDAAVFSDEELISITKIIRGRLMP